MQASTTHPLPRSNFEDLTDVELLALAIEVNRGQPATGTAVVTPVVLLKARVIDCMDNPICKRGLGAGPLYREVGVYREVGAHVWGGVGGWGTDARRCPIARSSRARSPQEATTTASVTISLQNDGTGLVSLRSTLNARNGGTVAE